MISNEELEKITPFRLAALANMVMQKLPPSGRCIKCRRKLNGDEKNRCHCEDMQTCGTVYEKRTPDEDLKAAFYNNNPPEFKLEDIDNILAEVAGENDEYNWFWIVVLKDGKFALIDAWCDYTGWDCRSGVSIDLGNSIDEVLDMAPVVEKYSHRHIRVQLKRQLMGVQPFGLYDDSIKDVHESIVNV